TCRPSKNSSTAGTPRRTPSAPTSPATTAPSATSSTPSTNSATTATPSFSRGASRPEPAEELARESHAHSWWICTSMGRRDPPRRPATAFPVAPTTLVRRHGARIHLHNAAGFPCAPARQAGPRRHLVVVLSGGQDRRAWQQRRRQVVPAADHGRARRR